MTIENDVVHEVLSAVFALSMIALGIGAVWLNITRKRGGFRNWGDEQEAELAAEELAMPCTHSMRTLVIESSVLPSGNAEVLLVVRCRHCNADTLHDFVMMLESDGRIVIENATSETIAVVVDGELFHLEPHGNRNPAMHVIRPGDGATAAAAHVGAPFADRERLQRFQFDDPTNGGRFDPQSGQGL